jgi:hypothetical protein
MKRKKGLLRARWAGGVLLALLFAQGCSQQSGSGGSGSDAGADSVAYAQAVALEDEPARLAALQKFVESYPRGDWAARAYPRLAALTREHAPGQFRDLLTRFAATDFPSSDPYNEVGWDLAEAGEHLDLAVPILEKAVAKARAGGDSQTLAACLDSEAWARHKAGDHATAVARMEEAYKVYGPGNDEIDEHMALIYDAAGQDAQAAAIYKKLLGHMEHPAFRANLETIVRDSGGSIEQTDAEIQAARAANKAPAPDFTMASLADGSPVSLKDYRGKVVLLNFWHPT